MSLTYDFDIHEIIPQGLSDNPAIAELLQSKGIDLSARGNHMALFRDAATAAALKGASENVRTYFETSGFGFTTYDSGAGPSRFPARDSEAMTDIVARLKENYSKFDLKHEDWNGFSFKEFIAHIKTMKPVAEASAKPSAPKGGKRVQGAGADGMTPLERVRVKEEERQAALMAQLGIQPMPGTMPPQPQAAAAPAPNRVTSAAAPESAAVPLDVPPLDPNVGLPNSAAISAAQVSKTYGRASRSATAMLAGLVLGGAGLAYLAIEFAPVPEEATTAQASVAPSIGEIWRERMIENLFPGAAPTEEAQAEDAEAEPEKIIPRVVYR